jgi:hypothetical protein
MAAKGAKGAKRVELRGAQFPANTTVIDKGKQKPTARRKSRRSKKSIFPERSGGVVTRYRM